jgi:Na+/H+ antiporter NhaA
VTPSSGRARGSAQESQPRSTRTALAAQLSAPLRQFVATEGGSAGIMLAAALLGLLWANSPWAGAYQQLWQTEAGLRLAGWSLVMDLRHWVDDGLMALFFFIIGLEVRRELSVGELTDRRRVRLPLLAGLAGMLLPVLLYLAINPSGDARNGWGIVIGTDTAFMLGALAVVGPRFSTQLRIFLLTLTVIDDVVAVTVIGVVYSDHLEPVWLAAAGVLLVGLGLLDRVGGWRAAPYVVLALLLWLSCLQAGLHSSIAGMLAGLLIAARTPDRDIVESAARRFRAFRQSPMVQVGRSARLELTRAISVNERLQSRLHRWVSYAVVPLFALANTGVDLGGGVLGEALRSPVTWGVVAGLVGGKFVGIGGAALVGARLGVGRLPQGVGTGHVGGGAALTGIGFTISLLIAGLAFDDPELRDQATIGVLLSAVLATALGGLVFRIARLRGEGDADLPRLLAEPVDPDHDPVRGPVDARLTLVEYGDFECPFCARATGVGRELGERLGDDLRYVFRHLPLPDVHSHAEQAARAAVAADRQGRFWEMHDLLFERQDHLELEHLFGYADALELDVDQFARDIDSDEVHARVRRDAASAEASGARGTPTFFVNGRRHTGPHDADTLARELAVRSDGPTVDPVDPAAGTS